MKENKSCVNLSSKLFKNLAKRYNAETSDLENAIKQWIDSSDYDGLPEASDLNGNNALVEFLDSYYKTVPMGEYSNSEYKDAHTAWEKNKEWVSKGTNTNSERIAMRNYNALADVFGKDNVVLFKNTEGKYVVRVAEPVLKKKEIDSSSYLPVEHHEGKWTRGSVAFDTETLYIFTDNVDRDSGRTLINPNTWYAKKYGKDKHYPTVTQAVIRGLDNAFPISTQHWYHPGAKGKSGRWYDKDIKEFTEVINEEIKDIKKAWESGNYKRIVIGSGDGILNGEISEITKERTPLLYKTLLDSLSEIIDPKLLVGEDSLIESTPKQTKLAQFSYARTSYNSYEVSSKGDKRFSALNAKFAKGTIIDGEDVSGKSIEWVYQNVVKKSGKGKAPAEDSILHRNYWYQYFEEAEDDSGNLKEGRDRLQEDYNLPYSLVNRMLGDYNTKSKGLANLTKDELEDISYYIGYLPLWQEWAKQNPELMNELRDKAKGKVLTDVFASTRVSQARALADILNSSSEAKEVSLPKGVYVREYKGTKYLAHQEYNSAQDTDFTTFYRLKNGKVQASFNWTSSIEEGEDLKWYDMEIKTPLDKEIKEYLENKSVQSTTKYPVTKIISGGQTGVDTIGLQVAKELGITTGGKAPKGYKREVGYDKEDIKSYGLEEITDEEQSDYTKRTGKKDSFTGRTELNVRNSDGTVYFYTSDDKLGYYATRRSAKDWNKPFITNPTPEELAQWIINNNIKTLNVAGNRGTKLSKDNNVADTLKKALEMTSQDNKPISTSSRPENKEDKLQESKELVDRIMEDSKATIRRHPNFDKEGVEGSHTYQIKRKGEWVNVDVSVTQHVHGKVEMGGWGLPSSKIGNTADRFTRAYFEGKDVLKENIPNLTRKDKRNLKNDLDDFREYLDNKFGGRENYHVVTQEFPIVGEVSYPDKEGNIVTKTIAGTMDMLIYDDKGNFYIYDMKTSRSGIDAKKLIGYSRQLEIYKAILEANYPELKGKIKELKLIEFDVYYPTPQGEIDSKGPGNTSYAEIDTSNGEDSDTLLFLDEDGEYYSIESNTEYQAPRLHISPEQALLKTRKVSMEESFKSLSQDEKLAIQEEIRPQEEQKEVEQEKSAQVVNQQINSLYNNPLLSASERMFLANNIMNMFSAIITDLQNNPDAREKYLGKDSKIVDFSNMSRQDIISEIGVAKIFNYIKEAFYNPRNRRDITNLKTKRKLKLAYENFTALTKSAYAKLITLEGVTVVDARPDEITREDIDDPINEGVDADTLEDKEREYWQIGQRQISAKSSLSGEIRRAFEKLLVTDNLGNPIADKYGFNFPTYVDSGEAVNKILDWCHPCTTMKEMEDTLKDMQDSYPWVKSVLEKIKEEPFRSQFFQNFRKDFTQYSIVTVEKDEKGNKTYKTTVINTKGAESVILNGVTTAYKNGLLRDIIIPIAGDIDGRGRVNLEGVNKLIETSSKLGRALNKAFSTTIVRQRKEAIKSVIPEFTEFLRALGIDASIQVLTDAFASDYNKKNKGNTTFDKVLSKATFILTTIKENSDRDAYNPILKEEKKGNVYMNYLNIVKELSRYIQDSIESSTYENGKMHYSFTTPSYMGKLILNLSNAAKDEEKFTKFMNQEYGSYKFFKEEGTSFKNGWRNAWLRALATSSDAREGIQHKAQLAFNKTPYNELSELSYTLSLMTEYFYDKNKKWAWYRVPILANKPSSEFIRFKRYSGKNYQENIAMGLKDVFDQEVMRMKTVLERAVNPDIEKIGVKEKVTFDIKDSKLTPALIRKIKTSSRKPYGTLTYKDFSEFKGSGAEFKFLSAFNNNILKGDELGKLIVDKLNGKEINEEKLEELFYDNLYDYMDAIVENEKSHWKTIGLYDKEDSKDKKSSKYKYINSLGKTESEINDALTEYVWNDMFATINIIELTATDLAYYKNIEDFQKRYAQVHNPSMRLNVEAVDEKGVPYSKDGKERTIYLRDSVVKSEIIPIVRNIFDNKIKTLANNEEKKEMSMMRDLIIESFEEVNVADAQGYSSPTSYRKKMGMMGKWSTEMEDAYNRIKSGDFNVNDLGVVWQPLKPFVYSQIRKPSGADTMSELKVPVQNKNSEYVLLLADALMRGGKQKSKLTAIFDFMEESAYTDGKYNGEGIDTVQFESAVNSGSMGAIDINDVTSYKDVKKRLEDKVYFNAKHTADSKNNNDRYDSQHVHTISFEDYGIQQEVPAHLHQKGGQLMGSQVRILSISDITPNTEFEIRGETISGEDLKDEYQKLIADNIYDSFDRLAKDFALKGTKKQKNIEISRLLIDAIQKDQRYGSDLLRACSLNENGEFTIPLNDPIQSIRIQQLINSIIKSRINKQKVPGGPVVQASVFGMSDDLKIVWKDKKKGIVEHFECYMPVPSEELEKALTKYDKNGHAYLMSIEEAKEKKILNDEMLKAIGYRIPTEDKYSMAPLYIKGFLPKAAGQAIMLPKEITTLSGSDFDIDKLYIMLKAYKFNHPHIDYKLVENLVREELTKLRWKPAAIKNYIKGNDVTGESSLREYLKKIEDGVSFSRYDEKTGEDLEDTKGNQIYDWVTDNESKLMTEESIEEYKDLKSREGRNNRIFDIQWSVLTNQDTAIKLFNPGSFEVQKKSARIINILKSTDEYSYEELSKLKLKELDKLAEASSNRNIVLSSTQVYFHKQNMTAGKLIGVFANNNTSHAFLSMQNISLKLDKGFRFDGKLVNSEMNNKLDELHAKDGYTLISKTIAGFLAASVDAVKDPVLNHMNLNTFTANTAMLLARLGFDSDSIGLFLTQPIIEQVTREYFKRSNEGYTSIDDVIKDFLPNDEVVDSIENNLENTNFTKEDLAEGIMEGLSDTSFQYNALVLFKKLSDISQDLNTLTFLTKFNSVTNAVGPTIADTLVMSERYKKFIDGMEEGTMPFNENALNILENSPILNAFYSTTLANGGASELIFKDYFPHYTDTFQYILALLRKETKGSLDAKTINKLMNDFILFKLTLGDNPIIDGSKENRKKYIIDFVETFQKESESVLDNELLSVINVKGKDNKCPVPTLEAKTGGYSIDIQERVKNAWSNLMINPETRKLGTQLFFYNIFRSGFGFSPKTFGHLASVDVKQLIPNYIETIRDVEFNNLDVDAATFLYMFRRNHSQDFKLVPKMELNNKLKVVEGKDVSGVKTITIPTNKFVKRMISPIVVSTSDSGTVYAPVIEYDGILYMNPITIGDSVRYTMTTTLGNTNNFLEYDGKAGAKMKSVLKEDTNKEKESDDTPKDTPDTPQETTRRTAITPTLIKQTINKFWGTKDFNSLVESMDAKQYSRYSEDSKMEIFAGKVSDIIANKLGVKLANQLGKKIKKEVNDKLGIC